MTTKLNASRGSVSTRLLPLLLIAAAIGGYLKVVTMEAENREVQAPATHQVSVRVVEGDEPLPASVQATIRDLPAEQMALILDVFAPEMKQ